MRFQKQSEADGFPESLEARLRALTPPPVNNDLEARILAAIPASIPDRSGVSSRRRFALAIVLASACSLVILLQSPPRVRTADPGLVEGPKQIKPVPFVAPKRSAESYSAVAWLHALRDREVTFAWPIREKSPLMVSTAISTDLLD